MLIQLIANFLTPSFAGEIQKQGGKPWDRGGITLTAPPVCLFYQVEIRYRQLPPKRTARPIAGADMRESTMRLWQPHG
jgi:hypothetical protein